MNLFNKHLGLALAISFVAVACAAPTIPSGVDGDDDSEESEGATTTKKPSTSKKKPSTPSNNDTAPPESDPTPSTPADPTPTTPPPPAGNCGAQQGDACFDCCDQASGGELAKADDVFGQCACGGGQCTSVCGSFCNGGQPSAQCDQCLTQTCEPAADAQCTSAACQAGLQCLQQCQ